MAALLVFFVLLAGIALALEHNHRRARPRLPAGSANFEDRDLIRVRQELHVAPRSGC